MVEELSELVRVALPLGTVQAGYSLMGLVDTLVAGRLGTEAVAAAGLGAALFFGVSVIGIGVGLGLDPWVAQAFGAGRLREARAAMWQGLYLAALVAVPLAALLGLSTATLAWFGVAPELAEQTRSYMAGRLPNIVPLLATVAVRGYLQAAHRTGVILASVIAANVVNLVGNWLLGLGDGGLVALGLPAIGLRPMGVFGLGLASTAASVVQLLVLAAALRKIAVPTGGLPVHRPDARMMRGVLRMGLPMGLQMLAEVGVFATVGIIMGSISAEAMAAHQIALMVASLSFSFCLGIGSATAVQVGRAVGRGDARATRRSGLLGIGVGAAFMLVPACLMAIWPEVIARWATDDPELVAAASRLLRIAAAFQVVDGVQAVATGALRGAGVARWPFVANVAAHWLVGLPAALYFGFVAGEGPVGLWWGLTAGLVVIAGALTWKFEVTSRAPIRGVLTYER